MVPLYFGSLAMLKVTGDLRNEVLYVQATWRNGTKKGVYSNDKGKLEGFIPDSSELRFDSEFLKDIPHDTNDISFTFHRYNIVLGEFGGKTTKTVCRSQYSFKVQNRI